ncbi:hypothetical protein [Nocardioides sp. P5_E3]
MLLRDPALAFVYDANQYWSGATAVGSGGNVYDDGGLATRGVLTPLVYVPAFFLAELAGSGPVDATWAVLIQNSFLIALLGSVVVPALLRRVVTIGPAHVGLSTAITGLALSGFAPYPVMDLPAVVCVAVGVLLLCEVRWWSWILGGGFLAAAVNLRPAYVLPAVLILAVVAIVRWPRAPLGVVGAAAVTGVQAMYGHVRADVWSASPPLADLVRTVQYQYGAYGVRYDTIPFTNGDPRLWHCSPGMADAMRGQPMPTSASGLLGVMVDNLPTSAGLAMDKFTASLHWSTATPYSHPGEQALRPLGIFVILVSCVGFVALVALLRSRTDLSAPLALVAMTLGVAVTLVGSSPEPRFALPLVVAGAAGVVAASSRWGHRDLSWSRPLVIGVGAAVLLTGLVAGLGWRALQQDVPRGDLTVEICQQA